MARCEPIRYRLLPAGRVFVAAGLFLAVAMSLEPALTAPVLVAWLTIATLQVLWPRMALRRVQVSFLPPPRFVRAGEDIVLAVELTNTSSWLRPGPVFLQPVLSGRVTALPMQEVFDVPLPGEPRVMRVNFGIATRGRRHAWCEAIEMHHPFALAAATLRTPDVVVPLMVWCARIPGGLPDAAGGWMPAARPATAVARRRQPPGNEHRAHLRNYRPGDPARAIQWRISARARELIVIERQHSPTPRFWLCIDTVSGGWLFSSQFERMLQVATTIVEDAYRKGRLRGIVLNRRSRRIADRHALGVALDTLASLRHSREARARRYAAGAGDGGVSSARRTGDILDLLPAEGRKVKLADTHGRTVLEV